MEVAVQNQNSNKKTCIYTKEIEGIHLSNWQLDYFKMKIKNISRFKFIKFVVKIICVHDNEIEWWIKSNELPDSQSFG